MRLILIFSLIFFLGELSAQINWYNNGQIFQYEATSGFQASDYGIHTFTVEKDTVYYNVKVKKIRENHTDGYVNYYYVYQDGAKIFSIDYLGNKRKEYDFTLKAGEVLNGYYIESIGDTIIYGLLYKTQLIQYFNSTSLIVEGFGLVGDPLFKQTNYCSPFLPSIACSGIVDGHDYFFRCFRDGGIVYDPYNLCTTSTHDLVFLESPIISPNPVTDFFTIYTKQQYDQVRLMDNLGRLVMEYKNTGGQYSMPVSLQAGVYFVVLIQDHKSISTQKIIK